MATDVNTNNRLQSLNGSDYEIVTGEPDIRGWDVRDQSTRHIGKVDNLIFDPQARKVRYIVVKVDKNYDKQSNRNVLVPIGLAELHRTDDDAFLPGITAEQLAALPTYDGNITSNVENKIRAVLEGAGSAVLLSSGAGNNANDFYNHDHFNEDNLFKNRRDANAPIPIIEENLNVGKQTVETGGAYIRSRIIEQPVEETINLQEQHVQVQRTPVDKPISNTDFDTFKEGVVELKEYAEVPVVSKEARVVEEVTVGKEVNERNETVRDTVRKTEVDFENITPKNNNTSTSSFNDAGVDN